MGRRKTLQAADVARRVFLYSKGKSIRSSRNLRPEMVAFLDDFTQDGMGYDPLLCAQDKPASISATASRVTGGWASVDVTTSFEGHGFSVELIQNDGDWLIDKVNCAP